MPYKQSWLAQEAALGGRATLRGTPEEMRASFDHLTEVLRSQQPPPSDQVETNGGEVKGIKYRLYWPKGASEPLPVGLWGI
jgi:versiconal hemiacetal acetate esterase